MNSTSWINTYSTSILQYTYTNVNIGERSPCGRLANIFGAIRQCDWLDKQATKFVKSLRVTVSNAGSAMCITVSHELPSKTWFGACHRVIRSVATRRDALDSRHFMMPIIPAADLPDDAALHCVWSVHSPGGAHRDWASWTLFKTARVFVRFHYDFALGR